MKQSKDKIYDLLLYILLTIFTLCVAYVSLGEGFDFNTYLGLSGGDGVFGLSLIKSIQENGLLGIYLNSRIGAPDVASLIDYPVLDIFMAFVVWVISWFTTSTPRIMYTYYILTYALDAVALAVLLRKLNIKRIISFVVGAIFAFVPFHFFRGMGHSTLINYMFFAVAVYLSLYILGFFDNEKKWKVIVAAIFLGIGYGYYYAFGLIIMAIAIIIRFCKELNFKKIISYIWVPVVTLASVLCTLLPKIIYANIYGTNEEVGSRVFYEQEIYGLKIIQLLFPPSYSRITAFSELTADYSNKAPLVNENATAALGLVAGVGFVILCGALIYSFVAKDKCNTEEWLLIDYLSLSTVALVLMGAIGGFGEIFNYFITSQIRCYNRSSIFIAGLALIMIAILLNKINPKMLWITWVLCIATLCISMYDTVVVSTANWQEGIRPIQQCYEEFFTKVENTLDEDAMVYQLPYYDFPESGSFDYKHFIGYLFTDTLRWSYGGVKGRNNSAKDLLDCNGKSYKFLQNLKDAGFEAVYIDIAGYDDEGASVLAFYNSLGTEPIISSDGVLYLYDIRNIDTGDKIFQKLYNFVELWNDKYNMVLSENEIYELAIGIEKQQPESYTILYNALKETNIVLNTTNQEYVDFLYTSILNRTESDDEQEIWVDSIIDGESREDVFYSFLSSNEFQYN